MKSLFICLGWQCLWLSQLVPVRLKKKSDIRVLMQDSTDAHGVQRMTARKSEVDIKYKGKEYHSFISRTPNDSLPGW